MSPAALLEIEEKAHSLIHLDAVSDVVDKIFALDVSDWKDESLVELESIIDQLITVLSATPFAQHRQFIARLLQAREGVEQGLSPDPAKRPTAEAMREFVARHLS